MEKLHQDVREVGEKYTDRIWNQKDLKAIDECVHKDIVIHSLLGDYHGIDAMRTVVQAWLTGFPDLVVKMNAVICEKDKAAVQWTASGTHLGIFKAHSPIGKKVSYSGVTIYRVQSGKIIEYWAYLDMQHLLSQL